MVEQGKSVGMLLFSLPTVGGGSSCVVNAVGCRATCNISEVHVTIAKGLLDRNSYTITRAYLCRVVLCGAVLAGCYFGKQVC